MFLKTHIGTACTLVPSENGAWSSTAGFPDFDVYLGGINLIGLCLDR